LHFALRLNVAVSIGHYAEVLSQSDSCQALDFQGLSNPLPGTNDQKNESLQFAKRDVNRLTPNTAQNTLITCLVEYHGILNVVKQNFFYYTRAIAKREFSASNRNLS
jgi:hypothetical protein